MKDTGRLGNKRFDSDESSEFLGEVHFRGVSQPGAGAAQRRRLRNEDAPLLPDAIDRAEAEMQRSPNERAICSVRRSAAT